MSDLKKKLKLNDRVVSLLERADCADIESLASADLAVFCIQLELANRQASMYKRLPAPAQVEKWIEKARWYLANNDETSNQPEDVVAIDEKPVIEDEPVPPAVEEPVNFELDPDVVEMIALSPLALPLAGKVLAAAGVAVGDIPEAILLTSARGDVSMRVSVSTREKPVESSYVKKPVAGGVHVNTISFSQRKDDGNSPGAMRLRSTSEFLLPTAEPVVVDNSNEERVRLLRETLPKTNEGISQESRRYVRGVLHSHPGQVWWGAVFTLALQMLIPAGIFSAIALLMKDVGNASFQWVPGWFLVFPCGVFLFGLLYLCVSYNATCRICGQRCFVPRQCLKNSKAHYIPVLGYIFSAALHMVLFSWFRCTYCGTPVRLKQ